MSCSGDKCSTSLRRSIAIVIAGILGLDSHSTILNVQLFEPMRLKNTYIPGFMVCLVEHQLAEGAH